MRRKLFSRIAFLIMTMFVISQGTAVYAEDTASSDNSLSAQQQIIFNYYNSINQISWDQWANYYTPVEKDMILPFLDNPANSGTGIMSVSSANVISAEKTDSTVVPKYPELNDFYTTGAYECYIVAVDMIVSTDSDSYFNGVNYKLVTLVQNNGEWEVGSTSDCPYDILTTIPDTNTQEAINNYNQRINNSTSPSGNTSGLMGIEPYGTGYGLITCSTAPASIKIYSSGTVYTETMQNFVLKTVANEIPSTYNAQAIAANCMAIKMCGWWAHAGSYRDTYGADIMTGDVDYQPSTNVSTISSNYSTGWNTISAYKAVSSSATGGELFYTAYYAGTAGTTGSGSGQLQQNGSNYMANTYGYTWQTIMHFYYDNSAYNNPNVGTIQIM
jgi:hypothetical protein